MSQRIPCFSFKELSASDDRLVTHLTLATGTATFFLQPASYEFFFVETPTDTIRIATPDTFFIRIDAYLDATGFTPQDEGGDSVRRRGLENLQVDKGHTVLFQAGSVVQSANASPVASDWDTWVSTRVAQRRTVMAAALKASGLSSPIPALADLYEHGSFFECEPYGTCWDPAQSESEQPSASRSALQSALQSTLRSTLSAQSPAPAPAKPGFQPQTVTWKEPMMAMCGFDQWRTVVRVADTPAQLQELQRLKIEGEQTPHSEALHLGDNCFEGNWIRQRDHYVRLVASPNPPRCLHEKCGPPHPRGPVWARVGDKVGFVPRHPNDVDGKPPINLKYGLFIPPSKPGDPVERVAWDASQKIKLLDKPPVEFQNALLPPGRAVSAPEIHAHLALVTTAKNGDAAHQANSQISYDYQTRRFMMAAASVDQRKSKEVAVGAIGSNGKLASFAGGHSNQYAASFARSSGAASYSGSIRGSGGSGSYSSGGGRGSGSSGSGSSGSHSSGSASSSISATSSSASSAASSGSGHPR